MTPIYSRLNRVITEVDRPAQATPEVPVTPPVSSPGPPPHRPRSRFVLVSVTVLLFLAGWAFWLQRSHLRSTATTPAPGSVRTATVEWRDFVSTLRLGGTVEAVESVAITAPRIAGGQIEQMTITKLVPPGARVHRGDVLVEFDRQPQIRTFLDKKAEYEDLVDQIARKQADEAAARAKDDSDLIQAEDQLKRARLEEQRNEILSRIDAEKNQEALTEAEANLKALRATFELKRKAAASAIHGVEIQRDRAQEIMRHAEDNGQRMSIRSPIDGVVVIGSIWRGGSLSEVQEGDQVGPWNTIMQVVDPSAMQVRVEVNQEDVLALKADQAAIVRLDAYPDFALPAHLQELAPMGETSELSDKVRTFNALYRINGTDPRLVPDLSAAVDVQTDQVKGALVVPRECVAVESGRYYVWAKSRTGFERREVQIGAESDLEAVVLSGLKGGELVLRGKG